METLYDDKSDKLSDDKKEKCFKDLKKVLEADEDLKNWRIGDEYINRYMLGSSFDFDATLTKLRHFYELMRDHPNWCRTPSPIVSKHIIELDTRFMIPPAADKEGRPICIAKVGNADVSKMDLLDQIDVDDIWLEYLLLCDPLAAEKGLCVIVDIANYSWKLLKWMTPENVKLSVKKLQALPFKDYRFHIVNNSVWIKTAINIAWPFLPQYVKKMIKFHFDDWESFHQHIDKEVLPIEYKGFTQVNYNDYYNKLFDMNDEIVSSFKKYRIIKK